MISPSFYEHPHADAMADSLASRIATGLKATLSQRGQAGLIVSGGSTPLALFKRLAQADIAWNNVVITLADERLVNETDADSNARLVRSHLLQGHARDARFISLIDQNLPPENICADTNKRLCAFPWPSDFTILGMGHDGHTASLFPGADALEKALDKTASHDKAIMLEPKPLPVEAPYQRITLTLPTLLKSNAIILMIQGPTKRYIYETALSGSSVADMPVRGILYQDKVPVETHWAP